MTTILIFFGVFIAAIVGVIVGSVFYFKKSEEQVHLKDLRGVYFNTGLLFTMVLLFCAFNYKVEYSTEVIELADDASKEDIKPTPVTVYVPPETVVKIETLDIEEIPDKEIVKEIKEIVVPEEFIRSDDESDIDALFGEMGMSDETFEQVNVESSSLPEFKCDWDNFMDKHRVYPEIARENNISGVVGVRVYVNVDGTIDANRVSVTKGVHPEIDNEAVRLVKKASEVCGFTPGKQRGNVVRSPINLTIKFNLGE